MLWEMQGAPPPEIRVREPELALAFVKPERSCLLPIKELVFVFVFVSAAHRLVYRQLI